MSADDLVRVGHMIQTAGEIARFIAGRERVDLDSDHMLLFAIVRAIEIFGEAASQLSNETHASAPQVPWRAIIGMRNRIIHAYWDIDSDIVWRAAAEEIPALLPVLRTLAGQIGGDS
jgi:uncharacterized protein with HEPN domain